MEEQQVLDPRAASQEKKHKKKLHFSSAEQSMIKVLLLLLWFHKGWAKVRRAAGKAEKFEG